MVSRVVLCFWECLRVRTWAQSPAEASCNEQNPPAKSLPLDLESNFGFVLGTLEKSIMSLNLRFPFMCNILIKLLIEHLQITSTLEFFLTEVMNVLLLINTSYCRLWLIVLLVTIIVLIEKC